MQPLAEVLARLFRTHAERCNELSRAYRASGKAVLAERQEVRGATWEQAAAIVEAQAAHQQKTPADRG